MTKRAKRFERQPDTLPEPRLTSRDVAILRHVSRHRFLNSQQIMQLVGDSPRIVRRLQSLFHAGYLDRPRAQLTYYASAGSSPLVYALGRKGAQVIADTDHDHDEAYRWTLKNRRAGQVFVQHTIEAADILVRLQKSTATSTQVKLVTAEEIIAESPTATLEMRAPTKLTVDVAYKEKRYRLSVIPDGMLALEFRDDTETPERSNFFLELDRETMPVMRKSKSLGKEGRQSSLLSKFLTYYAVWRQGLHKERFGWENFRVLTVTTSKKRVDTMIAAVKEITDGRGSSLFLFTDQETLGDKSVLDIAWRSGKGEIVRLND
jgi:hypothetical protein